MKIYLIRLLIILCVQLSNARGGVIEIRPNLENLQIRDSYLGPFGETMHRLTFSLGDKVRGFLLFLRPGGGRTLFVDSKELINADGIMCFVPKSFQAYFRDSDGVWVPMMQAGFTQQSTGSFVLFSSEEREGKGSGPYSGIVAIELKDVFSLTPGLLEALGKGDEVTIKIKICASQLILTTGEYKIVDVESAALICRLNESETTKSDSAPKINGASTETQGIMAEPMPSSPAN